MEKFAGLGVDSVGIAHSERAAGTNRDSPNVDSGLLACWHFGSHHVAGPKRLTDLPSPVNKLEQTEDFRRLVAVLLGDDRDARNLAAGIDLDPDGLNIAPDAVLQANREGVTTMHNHPAAREKQASPLL
jgi:hypothetical protein